jgi:hypothetical protein
MSNRKKVFFAALASAAAALLLPISALAASYTDNVGGIEIYATSTEGVFTGVASGQLPGVWSATVFHTPLAGTSTDPTQHATITRGSFKLVSGWKVVSGSFLYGGTVDQIGGVGSSCGNQVYSVDGTLTNSGWFRATLTHYRTWFFGRCLTYGASIAGKVSLN